MMGGAQRVKRVMPILQDTKVKMGFLHRLAAWASSKQVPNDQRNMAKVEPSAFLYSYTHTHIYIYYVYMIKQMCVQIRIYKWILARHVSIFSCLLMKFFR